MTNFSMKTATWQSKKLGMEDLQGKIKGPNKERKCQTKTWPLPEPPHSYRSK